MLYKAGKGFIAGFDEAGRGPLAGPVFAAAVILPQDYTLPNLRDSKLLSPKQRDELACQIQEQAIDYAVAYASVEEIDTLNILRASLFAMQRAYQSLRYPLSLALIDGPHCPDLPCPAQGIIHGDQSCHAISAASILAKVARDKEMILVWHALYPHYGFDGHKGYGTRSHKAALDRWGPSPIHRRSFRPVKACLDNYQKASR